MSEQKRAPKRKPRTFKVWVWPAAFARDMKNSGYGTLHKRQEGFKRSRVRATLTLTGKGRGKEGR